MKRQVLFLSSLIFASISMMPATVYANMGHSISTIRGGGSGTTTEVSAGLSNSHFGGSYTASGHQTGSGGVNYGTLHLYDEPTGYSFSCNGVTLTQGNGVNIQYLGTAVMQNQGGFSFLGGEGGAGKQAVNSHYVQGHAHVGITNVSTFKKDYPSMYQLLVNTKSVDGIHSVTTGCSQFTLADSLVPDQYLVTAILRTPWGDTVPPQQVGYGQQYCPAGAENGPKPGWHQEVRNLGQGSMLNQYTWQTKSNNSGAGGVGSLNIQFGCAGVYQIIVKDLTTGKYVSGYGLSQPKLWPVSPVDLVLTAPTPPPPSTTSGGNLWISK